MVFPYFYFFVSLEYNNVFSLFLKLSFPLNIFSSSDSYYNILISWCLQNHHVTNSILFANSQLPPEKYFKDLFWCQLLAILSVFSGQSWSKVWPFGLIQSCVNTQTGYCLSYHDLLVLYFPVTFYIFIANVDYLDVLCTSHFIFWPGSNYHVLLPWPLLRRVLTTSWYPVLQSDLLLLPHH